MLAPRAFVLIAFWCPTRSHASELTSSLVSRAPRRVRHVLEGPFLKDCVNGESCSPQLVLTESLSVSTGHWTGHRVWPSAVVLLQHLEETFGRSLNGLRILELGCGLPFIGAALAALGAEVCSTDHPDKLPLVQDVFREDPIVASLQGLSAAARARLRLHGLAWGEGQPVEGGSSVDTIASGENRNLSVLCGFVGPVDLVIGSDLVYDQTPDDLLQQTIVDTLKFHGAIAVLVMQRRRFPQASYLKNPQKIANFFRHFAAQPGDWEVVMSQPRKDVLAQFDKESTEAISVATVIPSTSRSFGQKPNSSRLFQYFQEELPRAQFSCEANSQDGHFSCQNPL